MRIAFYAPLKPPDHPVASGDRAAALGLMAALRLAGHDVFLASRFRSYDRGDPERQRRHRAIGARLAERLLRRFAREGAPDLWFTYHLYHKAPDWLGPPVAGQLAIPYCIAEASYAPKQAGGRWNSGHEAVAKAIGMAARVFQPNPADAACVLPLLRSPQRLVSLPPFLETGRFRIPDRARSRAEAADRYGLDPEIPWLLTAAMMRDDQKLQSYWCLANALSELTDLRWNLLVAGSGQAESEVRRAFAQVADRVRWAGALDAETLRPLYGAADLYAWPAIKEAWGMALLEAQAAGLPVVAGRSGGVAAIVADGETGLLPPEGDTAAFADALRRLLVDPALREAYGEAAMERAARDHDLAGAAQSLAQHLDEAFRETSR